MQHNILSSRLFVAIVFVLALVTGFFLGTNTAVVNAKNQIYNEFLAAGPCGFEATSTPTEEATQTRKERSADPTSTPVPTQVPTQEPTQEPTIVEIVPSDPVATLVSEPTACIGNPGNPKCVGKAGETPNHKGGWNEPPDGPGIKGRSGH